MEKVKPAAPSASPAVLITPEKALDNWGKAKRNFSEIQVFNNNALWPDFNDQCGRSLIVDE